MKTLCFNLLIVLALGSQGCMSMSVGALSALYTASSAAAIGFGALSTYKIVQLSTGGEVEIRLSEEEAIQNKDIFHSIESIAIYPGGGETVRIAEELSKASFEVITPAKVQGVLESKGDSLNLSLMTKQEQINCLAELCETLGADSIFILFISSDAESDMKLWSFDRAEVKNTFSARVFSKEREIVWDQEGELVYKGGSKMPAYEEVEDVFVAAVVERFMDDAAKS